MESLAIYNMLVVKNSSSNIAFYNYNEILAIVNFGNIFLTKYASLKFFKEVSASELLVTKKITPNFGCILAQLS